MDAKKELFAVINTVGWWLVHVVAAFRAPHDAMRVAGGMMPEQFEFEDLDEDTEEDE